MDDQLTIETSVEGTTAVLAVAGEVDLATCDLLRRSLEAVADSVARVEVDLSEVSFLDSSGLNVLLAAASSAPEHRELVLRRPTDAVRRVLDVGGISQVIPVVDD